jgi:hypothetical protein
MLHVACLWVPLESPFGETKWSQEMLPPGRSHHVFSAILPLPSDKTLMGEILVIPPPQENYN